MKYFTYILINEKRDRTYTGVTNNVERRLAEHNAGKVQTSKFYKPYVLFHVEEHDSLKSARNREIYFKSTSGRRELKKLFAIKS